MTKPVITAVNGLCCGAGLDWVTTGDITIASDRAEFFDPHVSIGLVSGREIVRLARVLPDQHRHADRADRPPRAPERPAGLRARPGLRGRRARPAARAGPRDRRAGQPQRAAGRAGHPPRHPQGPRPPAARGRDPGRGLPRAGRAHRRRQGGPGGLHGEAGAEVDGADDRPSRRSATRRRPTRSPPSPSTGPRCSTPSTARCARRSATAWQLVKDDPEVQRRGAAGRGRPGVLRRARHQEALRPARRRLEPRGPGRAAEPEVAEGVEAGRLRGAGHLHRRRLLLRQRVRHRHLLARGHLLRLARHLRHGVRARAGRPDAQGRPRRDAAHGAVGQRRAGDGRRPRCGSAWSPRSSSATQLWARAHEIAAGIAAKPTAATQGTVRAIWESLDRPYRAAMRAGPDLHPRRQPDRHGRGGREPAAERTEPRLR